MHLFNYSHKALRIIFDLLIPTKIFRIILIYLLPPNSWNNFHLLIPPDLFDLLIFIDSFDYYMILPLYPHG